MLENSNKKKYLVYQVGTCEQGSEGASSRYFFCVAEGNTKEEVIENWCDNVEILYGVRLHPTYNREMNCYYDYYPIYMNRLVNCYSYAEARPLIIIDKYRKHEPTWDLEEDIYEAE